MPALIVYIMRGRMPDLVVCRGAVKRHKGLEAALRAKLGDKLPSRRIVVAHYRGHTVDEIAERILEAAAAR